MFEKLIPLNKEKHGSLKIKPGTGFGFASKITHCFLSGSEVAEASKSFPVVFPQQGNGNQTLMPMALFSFSRDENYFVNDKGKWTADYVPNHIKRYPFIFAGIPEKDNQFAIMIDEDAPMLNKKSGQALFDKGGKPGEVIETAKKFLGQFQADIVKTQKVLSQLEEKDVLISKEFRITQGDKKSALKGFRVVDVKKLKKLDDATLAQWVRNGLMGIIFSHLNSFTNLKKVAQAQGAVEK